jgi:putative ABC transport system permease protein
MELLAYSVSVRQHEFGIRIALGSDKAALMRLVMCQAAQPVIVGVLAGLSAAFAATRWIDSLLYHTKPLDPSVILGSVGCLLIAAFAGAMLPARRAARTHRMQALRTE